MKHSLRVVRLKCIWLVKCRCCGEAVMGRWIDHDLQGIVCDPCAKLLISAEIQLRAWSLDASAPAFPVASAPKDGRKFHNSPVTNQSRRKKS